MKEAQNKVLYYQFNIDRLKTKKSVLEKEHEKAWLKVIYAENKLSEKEEKLLGIEKQIRSLSQKLSWQKRKNK